MLKNLIVMASFGVAAMAAEPTFLVKQVDDKGTLEIYYVYPDGRQQQVSDKQDLYSRWKAKGNVAAVEPYVAPKPVAPPSLESRVADAVVERRARYRDEVAPLIVEALALAEEEGREDEVAAAKAKWLEAKSSIDTEIPLPEE